MEKQEIIEYVMHTPGNSNPAVLASMLNSISGGSDIANGVKYKLHRIEQVNPLLFEAMTESEYDNLEEVNPDTLYMILED